MISKNLQSNGIQVNPITNERVDKWELSIRKLAHYVLFATGGMILYVALHYFEVKHDLLIPIFLGMLLACLDEWHQFYSSNRGPGLLDVGLDSLGVISGVLVTAVLTKLINRLKKGEKIYDKFQKKNCTKNCKSS